MNQTDFYTLESGSQLKKNIKPCEKERLIKNLSGNYWQMERMRPGQGIKEGIHLLLNEHSGNNFSWNYATVPGDVYTDLYRAGELEDMVYGRNMAKAKWVEDYEWWYNCSFKLDENMKNKKLSLVFEGVDYSCEVWINGIHLGSHEGMFSSFEFDITDYVNSIDDISEPNLITLKLDPPPKNQKNFAGMKHNFAGDYLTGLITFGIWRPVKIIAYDIAKIDNYRLDTNIKGKNAEVEITAALTSTKTKKAVVEFILSDGKNKYTKTAQVNLQQGKNNITVNMLIENAKLWWPYELGEPFLYNLKINLLSDEDLMDCISEKVGLRQVKMEHNPGFTKDESELPWTFVINGKSMFLRSACWGGQPSIFYEQNSYKKYRYYLEKAKEAHINNLRIFGWHPPETKDFYDICDELGITVWTNFTFATQVFRDDKEYLQKVMHEVRAQVRERRNHASNIIWMGGEEVFFSEQHVHSNNRKLMENVGKQVHNLTDIPYADASPLSSRYGIKMGYKTKESVHANSHYYAAGAVFMEDYYTKLDACIIPELTAASAPNVESLKKFIPQNELWPMGISWGYHAADIDVLKNLNYEVFGDECMDSLEHFVDATQIAQGTIFQFALEHFRRCKPHVSGVALCHFMTNWPIIKWDIIDYYGEKKKSYDFVKTSYQPLLPSLQFEKRRWNENENFKGSLWVVNDYYTLYDDLDFSYSIFDYNGNKVLYDIMKISVAENSSKKYGDINWKVKGKQGQKFKILLSLSKNNKVLANNEYILLIDDQEKAKETAKQKYIEMHAKIDKFGKNYYRYFQSSDRFIK